MARANGTIWRGSAALCLVLVACDPGGASVAESIKRMEGAVTVGETREAEIPTVRQSNDGGLVWMRCPLGKTWNGETCQGTSKLLDWNTAMIACPSGFRVPTRQELGSLLLDCWRKQSLLDAGICENMLCKCKESENCRILFGNDEGKYWSTDLVEDSNSISVHFFIDMKNGYLSKLPDDMLTGVRCVKKVR